MPSAYRPRIAILARFAETTSATRYSAIITARRLAEAVWAAGGEPITLLPVSGSDWSERLGGIDGVLMPGGADINPRTYGQEISSEHVYDVDDLADEADISLTKYALEKGIPFFAICRGLQITNVALGGTLIQHMDSPHQHHVAPVTIEKYLPELGLSAPTAGKQSGNSNCCAVWDWIISFWACLHCSRSLCRCRCNERSHQN